MNRNAQKWVIYGSGLSALVLAERLGRAGRNVVLMNPGKAFGGIFAGLRITERVFDAGMTNFEFDLFGQPAPDILDFQPDRKADVGRYVHFVRDYLSRFAKVHPIATPCMADAHGPVGDLLISNQFDALARLSGPLRDRIRAELQAIVGQPNPLHPRGKNEVDSPLRTATLEQASLANHGATLHHLYIEPFLRKVLGIPSAQVEAVFHRNGWVPLFHPETLLSQFGPAPQQLQPTRFHYPDDPHFGAFIGRIVDQVRQYPNVTILQSVRQVGIDPSARLACTDRGDFPFDQLAWGGELSQLDAQVAAVAGIAPGLRASLELHFLAVRSEGVRRPFAVLTDPTQASPFYRVTNQTLCRGADSSVHQIILECNARGRGDDAAQDERTVREALDRYGIRPEAIVAREYRIFAGALAIPSQRQMAAFGALREAVMEKYPGIHLMGPGSGYVSVTLNDHIIQALKIAKAQEALA